MFQRSKTHALAPGGLPGPAGPFGCVGVALPQGPRVFAAFGPRRALGLRRRLGPARFGLRPVGGRGPVLGDLSRPLGGDRTGFGTRLGRRLGNLGGSVGGVCGLVFVVVTDDRDLTGQLGDRHRITVAAPPPAPPGDRRGADGPVLSQQFGHRDRPSARALVLEVWSGHGLSPLDRLLFRSTTWPTASRTGACMSAVPSASLSSLRKMRPSRNAHGQISTYSIDSARMLAPAPGAPATICGARSALSPSSSARSAVVILEMKDMSCLRPFAVSVRFTRGPAADGAAPLRRANERNVFEVAPARSASPASSTASLVS